MKLKDRKKRSVSTFFCILIAIFLFMQIDIIGFGKSLFYPIYKNIEYKRTLNEVKNYNSIKTEHFIIRFNDSNNNIAHMVGSIAEKYYEETCNMFNYHPEKRTNIILYNEVKTLNYNVGLDEEAFPMGVYYCGVIHILSPENWVKDGEDLYTALEKRGPIVHEFTHLLVDDIAKGNYPMWLTEGIALYAEYEITGFEWGRDLLYNHEVTIKELNNEFYKLDQKIAYRKSFEIIRHISFNHGFDKLVLILNMLGRGNDVEKTTKAILKVNYNDLDDLVM